jgi:putative membrane protein
MAASGGYDVPDLTILPTAKFIKMGAVLAAIVVVGLEVLYWTQWNDGPRWVMALPVLLMLWPAVRYFRRQYTKATITGDRLRYDAGIASRTTRNIQLSKIQDVRVDQRMTQRLFGVGNIHIETAGESSRLTLFDVDKPQELADEIMNRVPKGAGL